MSRSRSFAPISTVFLAALAIIGFTPGFLPAADACLECHDKKDIGAGSRSVHQPFQEDDCGACHADHGDKERLVLTAEGNAVCDGCHDTGERAFSKAHRGIRGPNARCISCHDPHRSAEEHLLAPNRHRPLAFGRCDPCHRFDGRLLKPVRELCLECHGGEEFARRIQHAPVRQGQCLSCHDPHASREPFLLKARYALGRTAGGEPDAALCLGCHPREAFFTDDADRTLFRGGERNYHALHVRGAGAAAPGTAPRAASCRACHEVHTADSPRLVRRDLDCDGVPCLKLDYQRTDFGGQCLSGCHAAQSYAFSRGAEALPLAMQELLREPQPQPAFRSPREAVAAPTALEESINRRCVGCHEKDVRRFSQERPHDPVRSGACSACHLDHGPENRLVLLGPEDRICARCHDLRAAAAAAGHGGFALAGSRCTECHDPHGGDSPGFVYPRRHPPFAERDCGSCHGDPAKGWRIAGPTADVCRQCHDEIGRGKNRHGALAAKGCLGCHRAHAAREPKLLREQRPALCFECHQRERFAGEAVHDPVGGGDCGGCHPAHDSAEPGLLARPYPLEQYLPFDARRFGLCWECHDEGALTDPARAADTGFADGQSNLHALHLRDRVSKNEIGTRVQPGVTCRNCHDPHATGGPRLIRRVLDCNGVPCLQLEFHKVGAGGRCVGGCHVTKSYLPAADRR
jgi:predicted CXXCH cytochrome family protein